MQTNVAAAHQLFPKRTNDIAHYFVLSHRKRLLVNAWRNKVEAHGKDSVFVKSVGELFGTTAPTQDMLLWPGIELIGCNGVGKIVNGVIYRVEAVTEDKITVIMTEEFRASLLEMTNKATRDELRKKLSEEMQVVLSVLETGPLTPATLATKASRCQGALKRIFPTSTTPQRWHMLTQLFPDKLAPFGNKIALKDSDEGAGLDEAIETVELSHKDASTQLRLTYALTYANIQRRTIRQKHICLMDGHHRKFFTTRHLIVGMSRATHGRFVHVPSEQQEETVMRKATGGVSEDFLNFVDRQEHLAMPESLEFQGDVPTVEDPIPADNAHTAAHMGESKTSIQSLIQAPVVAESLTNSHLQGCERLRCEPCMNTLMTREIACTYCKRSREQIIAAQCV